MLAADAVASERMGLDTVDEAPDDALNQILWRALKGTRVPYPSWAVARDDDER